MNEATFDFTRKDDACSLNLSGNWQFGTTPEGASVCAAIPEGCKMLNVDAANLGAWDSSLIMVLLQLERWCAEKKIPFDMSTTPEGVQQLVNLTMAVPRHESSVKKKQENFFDRLHKKIENIGQAVSATFIFIGGATLAFKRWLQGKAKTRRSDIQLFIDQAGPKALPIVTLISLSVGMILAYLGSVQLRQLGAQVYVANLVSIGVVREMGALMTAIIVAGRTGAAYAAQLGTMQANEEIDALKTMGISSMEFLVLPRMLALIFIMPLLCIFADVIGMAGGALIASGMDVSFHQYILQTRGAIDWVDIFIGLFKSIVFGILIATAGCQEGLNCGRSSTAVGIATTNAVVKAIVYLLMADAAFNVLFDKLGI